MILDCFETAPKSLRPRREITISDFTKSAMTKGTGLLRVLAMTYKTYMYRLCSPFRHCENVIIRSNPVLSP